MKESRHWKRAFEEDVELPLTRDRVEISKPRKEWLKRAWTYTFGFVPNAVPIYNEREGFAHRPAIHVNWHHVIPIGEMNRLEGLGDFYYNDPRNIVPVEQSNHTGRGSQDDQFVIHPDTLQAFISYHTNPKAFIEMSEKRKEMTYNGLIYHEPDYDIYFIQLADQVISRYQQEYRSDYYPD